MGGPHKHPLVRPRLWEIRRAGGPTAGGRAIGRAFARYLPILPCYLGFLWMLWDDEDQTWHDKICDTVVIKAHR
jgi:uncharacterized RDD family membrane protein YckC